MNQYEIRALKDKFAESLNDIEQAAKIYLCTEKGINMGREFARSNFKDCPQNPNKAIICYAETIMSLNLFLHWWKETFNDINPPIVDEITVKRLFQICVKCSPKDGTGTGAGAGALGGLFVGGLTGAIIGGIAGAFAGSKLTEEASGEKYYSILRESIETLFAYLYSEICKQLDYSM